VSNIWHGATPTGQTDAADYEMGSVILALKPVTLTGIRVWSPANAVTRPNRRGRVWAMNGSVAATITMPDSLPSGWSTHLLASPIPMSPGDFLMISYETSGNYGAVASAFASTHVALDGAMAFPQSSALSPSGGNGNGRFNATPGAFPQTSSGAWYGVDADYTVSGGSAPTVTGLSLISDGLSVTATISAADPDGLTGATYSVDWGDGTTSSGSGTGYSHTYGQPGIKAVLARVTDSSGLAGVRAGAVEVLEAGAGLDASGVLNEVVSHAMRLGRFETVNGHEPKSAPGHGLSCAVWVDEIAPVRSGSGLHTTSARLVLNVRIYSSAESSPLDSIDPRMVDAVDALMAAYSADFTLGGRVRNVDLLGHAGPPMTATAGYIQQDGKLLRIFTITLPLIVSDAWEQAP
jgi:Domain of unknown function (DUF4082)/PKD domain